MYEANYINGEYHVFPVSNKESNQKNDKFALNQSLNNLNNEKNIFKKVYKESRKKQRDDIKFGYNREYPELFKLNNNLIENPITRFEKTDLETIKSVNRDIKRYNIFPEANTFRVLNQNCSKLNKKFISNTDSIVCCHQNKDDDNLINQLDVLSNKKHRIFSDELNPIYNSSYMPENSQQIRNLNDFSINECDQVDPLKVITYVKKPSLTYNPLTNSYKMNTGSVHCKSRWSNYLEK